MLENSVLEINHVTNVTKVLNETTCDNVLEDTNKSKGKNTSTPDR